MNAVSTRVSFLLSGLFALTGSATALAAESSRQAEVSTRGADVMPFSLQATTHIFSKVADGGVQQVIAKNPADDAQVRLIRGHLRQITEQFTRGDFSGPEHIHGMAMPGLAELRKAKSGEIRIDYQDIAAGGQVRYSTSNKALVGALHEWFDAQLSDHGADATDGHDHAHMKLKHD